MSWALAAKVVHPRYNFRLEGNLAQLDQFESYHEALAAWDAVDAERGKYSDFVRYYTVRNTADPHLSELSPKESDNFYNWRTVDKAVRKLRASELRNTAKWAVEKGVREKLSLDAVIRTTRKSLVDRGWNGFPQYDVMQAVKDRIILGREVYSLYGKRGNAYWFPKKEGPLYMRQSPNGFSLGQTTLALKTAFSYLPLEEATINPHYRTDKKFLKVPMPSLDWD